MVGIKGPQIYVYVQKFFTPLHPHPPGQLTENRFGPWIHDDHQDRQDILAELPLTTFWLHSDQELSRLFCVKITGDHQFHKYSKEPILLLTVVPQLLKSPFLHPDV